MASSPPRAGRNFLGTASKRENPINQRGLRAPLDTVRDVSTRNESATRRAETGKIRGICSRDVPQRDGSKIRHELGDLSYRHRVSLPARWANAFAERHRNLTKQTSTNENGRPAEDDRFESKSRGATRVMEILCSFYLRQRRRRRKSLVNPG